MDDTLRSLERRVAAGEKSAILKQPYVRAGKFWIEFAQDDTLGEVVRAYNLNVNGIREHAAIQTGVLTVGQTSISRPPEDEANQIAHREWRQCEGNVSLRTDSSSIVNLKLRGALDVALYEARNNPLFRPTIDAYLKKRQEEEHCRQIGYGVFRQIKKKLHLGLDELTLGRNLTTQTVFIPSYNRPTVLIYRKSENAENPTLPFVQPQVRKFISEIFGQPYDLLVPALQYCAQRNEGKRSQVQLRSIGSYPVAIGYSLTLNINCPGVRNATYSAIGCKRIKE